MQNVCKMYMHVLSVLRFQSKVDTYVLMPFLLALEHCIKMTGTILSYSLSLCACRCYRLKTTRRDFCFDIRTLFALSSKFAMSLFFVQRNEKWQRNVPLSAAAGFGTEAQAISPQRRGLSGSRRDGLISGVREWYWALITDHHPLPWHIWEISSKLSESKPI